MLLVQQVSLTWNKSSRGGAGAAARAGFVPAYPFVPGLPEGQRAKVPAKKAAKAPESKQPGALVQQLWFRQKGGQFLNETAACGALQAALSALGYTAGQIRQVIARRGFASPERWQAAAGPEKLDLVNTAFYPQPDGLAVRFYWDERRSGMPCRRGHNEGFGSPASRFCGRDCLNETAFLLMPGQYGRVLWNERRAAEDGWYYQLHLYNLYLVSESGSWAEDIFTCRRPDVIYQQLAKLY